MKTGNIFSTEQPRGKNVSVIYLLIAASRKGRT